MIDSIRLEAEQALEELIEKARPAPGALLVIGCSTSAVMGRMIGSASNEDAAKAILDGVLPLVRAHGLCLAVQGCEHINRSLVVENATMERYGLNQVWVKPHLHAGGAFATAAYQTLPEARMVEDLNAKAVLGMDVGNVLIGMHMRPVVVPVHAAHDHIGQAHVTLAFSRPKYVGGPRAQYEENLR